MEKSSMVSSVLLLLPILFSLSFQLCPNGNRLVRSTQHGCVRGKILTSKADNVSKFYSFAPIPYAKPPLGSLRFKAPQPAGKWSGIKDATQNLPICAQISDQLNGDNVIGSEDCLYLQIFEAITARTTENQYDLLPVMVWFHGGAFLFGSSNETTPDFLMQKPIVLVGVQYRLHVFGFLSTKDISAEGNNGLKDQLLALQWVKRNIAYFMGDPNKVTIFGESAGSKSVSFHMLSTKSQGFFHRAIGQSGVAINRAAYVPNPRQIAFKLGKGLGIQTEDSKILIKGLQAVDYKKLSFSAFNKSIVGFYITYINPPFSPSLERKHSEAFLTDRMYESLMEGNYNRVPYMLGFNTEEGSWPYQIVEDGQVDIDLYEVYPKLLIPKSMNIVRGSRCENQVLSEIEKFYFQNGNLTDPRNWIPYMSEDVYVRGISKTVDFIYKNIPTYFYKFSYIGEYHLGYLGGVGHSGEMQYLWYRTSPTQKPIHTEKDLEVSRRMVTLWTNFAKTGNPTPLEDEILQNITWPIVNDTNKSCLLIDNDLVVIDDPNGVDDKFWKAQFDWCGNPPYTTY